MHIGILSGKPGWHVLDLQRAATELGLVVTLLDLTQLSTLEDLTRYDALVLRMFPSGSLEQTLFRLSLLYQAERAGQRVINRPGAFEACVDKYSTTARLARAGLPVPATECCQTIEAALEAYVRLGGDVVVKPIFGSEGRGLIRVCDEEAAWRGSSMLVQTGAVLYLQEYIPHGGFDVRILVLGGQVLAAMRRRHPSDWRTNLARGAAAEPVTLTDEEAALAVRAAAMLEVDFAGVDVLQRPCGERVVIEVNAVPGWQGISQLTGMDVARKFLEWMYSGSSCPGKPEAAGGMTGKGRTRGAE